jgi:hypothetical protein
VLHKRSFTCFALISQWKQILVQTWCIISIVCIIVLVYYSVLLSVISNVERKVCIVGRLPDLLQFVWLNIHITPIRTRFYLCSDPWLVCMVTCKVFNDNNEPTYVMFGNLSEVWKLLSVLHFHFNLCFKC